MKYIFIIIIVTIGSVGFYFLDRDDAPAQEDVSSVEIQNPDSVIKYISENISSLSPEKEQLGGTFYVTNIMVDSGSGLVEYEDGHNAYSARFDYSYTDGGKVLIKNFTLVTE